jgi:lipocalin
MKFALATLALAATSAAACPGSDSFIHAKCSMSVSFTDSCDAVVKEMTDRVNGVNGWTDPHNGGTYTFTSTSPTSIEGQRVTGNLKYTDKFDFTFTESGGGCVVDACSESQVMSVLDYSTNYCNLHSLYCSSSEGCPTAGTDLTYTEKFSSCSQHDSVCVAAKNFYDRPALRGNVGECKPVTTAPDFDLDSYVSGRWYIHQQAETKYLPKEQNYCVYAEYTKMAKKSFWGYEVQVHNHAEEADKTVHDSGDKICAASADDSDAAKLEVSLCLLPKFSAGPYWVLAYDEAEGYALISGGQPDIETPDGCKSGDGTNNSGLWIFTRSATRDEALVNKVRDLAKGQGFDLSVLRDVDQTDCGY